MLGTSLEERRMGAYWRKRITKKTKQTLRKSPLRDLYLKMSMNVKKGAVSFSF